MSEKAKVTCGLRSDSCSENLEGETRDDWLIALVVSDAALGSVYLWDIVEVRWYVRECFQRTRCGLHGSNPMWVLHMSSMPLSVWRSPQQKEPGGVSEKGVIIDHLEETCILPCKGTAGGNCTVISTEEPMKASPPERGVTLITYWDHGEGGQVMIS